LQEGVRDVAIIARRNKDNLRVVAIGATTRAIEST
jgi:hypothetical protein